MRSTVRIARSTSPPRRGAALVEAALVLGLFLLILLGTLDLALAVLRDNTLEEAARRVARTAIVRGAGSADLFDPWGPVDFEGTAAEETEVAAAIRDILLVARPDDVQIHIEWPSGGNFEGDPVQVTMTSQYRPVVTTLFGPHSFRLTATSTMRIEH